MPNYDIWKLLNYLMNNWDMFIGVWAFVVTVIVIAGLIWWIVYWRLGDKKWIYWFGLWSLLQWYGLLGKPEVSNINIKIPTWHELQCVPLPKIGSLYKVSRLQEMFTREDEKYVLCIYSDQEVCKFLDAKGKVIEIASPTVPLIYVKV